MLLLIKWNMFVLACVVCSQELKFKTYPQLYLSLRLSCQDIEMASIYPVSLRKTVQPVQVSLRIKIDLQNSYYLRDEYVGPTC